MATSSFFKFLFLSFLFISVTSIHINGKCDHDHEPGTPNQTLPNKNSPAIDIEEDTTFAYNTDYNLSPSYPSFRIRPDYSLMEEGLHKDYIKDELMPSVIDYFQAALKIKRPLKGLLKVPSATLQSNRCNISSASAMIEGLDADFLIVVVSSTELNSTLSAQSSLCYRSATSGRPIISKMRFNTANVPLPNGDPLIHEQNVYLAIHEMVHALGFLKGSYQYFIDEAGNPLTNHVRKITLRGQNRTVLDLKPLTNRLREHFGCPSIPGALLEDDGNSAIQGSHFERRLFFYEVMTYGIMHGTRVSEFTLAVLEGSGWYIPDYNYAEPFFFGQGEGCEFWEGPELKNKSTPEYCVEKGSRGCFVTGRSGGRCTNDFEANGYSYYRPRLDFDCENPLAEANARLKGREIFGRETGSKCFTGTLSPNKKEGTTTSFCFKFQCRGQGLGTVLEVMIGNKTVVCKEEGNKRVEGYSGELVCPDPISYCNTVGKQYCPRNCMGRGECVDNKCKCKLGYMGVDCSSGSVAKELIEEFGNNF